MRESHNQEGSNPQGSWKPTNRPTGEEHFPPLAFDKQKNTAELWDKRLAGDLMGLKSRAKQTIVK